MPVSFAIWPAPHGIWLCKSRCAVQDFCKPSFHSSRFARVPELPSFKMFVRQVSTASKRKSDKHANTKDFATYQSLQHSCCMHLLLACVARVIQPVQALKMQVPAAQPLNTNTYILQPTHTVSMSSGRSQARLCSNILVSLARHCGNHCQTFLMPGQKSIITPTNLCCSFSIHLCRLTAEDPCGTHPPCQVKESF